MLDLSLRLCRGLRGLVVRMDLSSVLMLDGMDTRAYLLKSHLAGAGRRRFTVMISPGCWIGGEQVMQKAGAGAKYACGVPTATFNGFCSGTSRFATQPAAWCGGMEPG